MAISGNGYDIVPINLAVAATGGSNGMDARCTNADSVKDCRMSPTDKARHRAKTTVRPCTGRHTDADFLGDPGYVAANTPATPGSRASRKRAARLAA